MNKMLILVAAFAVTACGPKMVLDKDVIAQVRAKGYTNVVLGRKLNDGAAKCRLFVGTHSVQGRSKGQVCWTKDTDATTFTVKRLSGISTATPAGAAIPNPWNHQKLSGDD